MLQIKNIMYSSVMLAAATLVEMPLTMSTSFAPKAFNTPVASWWFHSSAVPTMELEVF